MTVTINWPDKIINVSRGDLTLVQTSPVEIRELNLNEFRLKLKDLEDDEEGMVFIRTHNHNTEVLLGGIVYARVLEIINGYTVTFEDGQYAVNIIGANSNVGDVVNVNQVSVRTANSAGLISNQAIEYASFNGGVTVDVINGTDGVTFPIGTPRSPVKTVQDAVFIAQFRGFATLFIKGDLTLDTGDNVVDYQLIGEATNKTFIHIADGALVSGIEIQSATVEGIFDGKASFTQCTLLDISFVEAEMSECTLKGAITLDGTGNTIIEDCRDGLLLTTTSPTIDFNGSGHNLGVRDYHGDLNIRNKTQIGSVEINMNSGGRVTLEPTVTAGSLRLTGVLNLIDNSTGAADVNDSQVIYPEQLQQASFGNEISIDVEVGESGTKFPTGTSQHPVNNFDDAKIIADKRGIKTFSIRGTLLLVDKDISDYIFSGENNISSVLILNGTGNLTVKTSFKNLQLIGILNGYVYAEACLLSSISEIGSSEFPTLFRDCILSADYLTLPALKLKNIVDGYSIHLVNCASGSAGPLPSTIDFNNSNSPIAFRKYGGSLTVKNITGNTDNTFEFSQGELTVDSSCTSGNIKLGGIYKINNNGTCTIEERSGSVKSWTEAEKANVVAEVGTIRDLSEISSIHAIDKLN
jgi:hypothetical protein